MKDLRTSPTSQESQSEASKRKTVSDILSTMRHIHWRLILIGGPIYLLIGTISLIKPISYLENPIQGWAAWGIVGSTTIIRVWGGQFDSYIRGTNNIALIARWQTLFNLLAIISTGISLLILPNLLLLVAVHQFWQASNVIRNKLLAGNIFGEDLKQARNREENPLIFRAAWPSAWRSAIGQLTSAGVQQILGIIFAQFGAPTMVASFLLSLRLLTAIDQFSGAPFYSKLPLLNRLRAEDSQIEQVRVARKGMLLTHLSFTTATITLGWGGAVLLKLIGSNTPFSSIYLWSILSFAFWAQRFGGMHIQLYSTTNHIVWHKINGIAGSLTAILAVILGYYHQETGFAISLLIGNILFASMALFYSSKILPMSPFQFEKKSLFPSILWAILCIEILTQIPHLEYLIQN